MKIYLARDILELIETVHNVDVVLAIKILPLRTGEEEDSTFFISRDADLLVLLRDLLGITSDIEEYMSAVRSYLSLCTAKQFSDEDLLLELKRLAHEAKIELEEG